MKKIMVTFALATAFNCGVMAQEPAAAPAAVQFQQDAPPEIDEPEIKSTNDAMALLDQFLSDKGWNEGAVEIKGKSVVIQKGIGTIAAPPNHPSYIDSRRRAFDKAMLDAKAKMAKYLESEISTAVERSYEEGSSSHAPSPQEEVAAAMAAMPDESICGKVVRLAHAKLDNMMKKEGVDFEAEKAAGGERLKAALEKMSKLCGAESFKKTITASAVCAVSGMQAYYVVEAQEAGKQGEIGVVAMWSPALGQMADSIVTGKPVPVKSAKRPIREQLPTKNNVLLSTFGVQQMIDERGNLVLVAFAQAGAKSKSKMASNAAYSKAALQAQALIRQFAGETVSLSETSDEAEQSLDYGEDLPDYSDSSKYELFQKSAAAKMKINGISTLKNWNAVHPITGTSVYGAICSWSPAGAAQARKIKKQIESTAKDGAAGRRTVPSEGAVPAASVSKPVVAVPATSSRIGTGAEGDDDAF